MEVEFTDKKDQLVATAARLCTLGLEVEKARAELKKLGDKKTPYDSLEMMAAFANFKELDKQWKELEAQHLALRDELTHQYN